VHLTAEGLSAADLVVLLTDHSAFDHELVINHAKYVLDTRNQLRGEQVEQL